MSLVSTTQNNLPLKLYNTKMGTVILAGKGLTLYVYLLHQQFYQLWTFRVISFITKFQATQGDNRQDWETRLVLVLIFYHKTNVTSLIP